MLKSLKAKLRKLSKSQYEILKQKTFVSKCLYNQALYTLKQAYRETKTYISFPKMDKIMKQTTNLEGEINYRLVKAQVSQQTLKRLDKSFKGYFNALKDFGKNPHKYISQPKPPKYIKEKNHNIIYTSQSFQIKQGYAVLEKDLKIKIPDMLLYEEIKQIEIIPKFKYLEAVFVYECPKEHKQVKPSDKSMAVDLGLDNLTACTTNGVIKPFVIDGRELKSINQYYNKKMAEFSGKRVYRGLYKSKDGVLINADINGSYNILRKSKPEFTFSKLVEIVKEGIEGWLHPCLRLEIS